MYLDGKERSKECPSEYQEILTQRYGANRYGQPRYKLVWGQTQHTVLGTTWKDKYGHERTGYRNFPQCNSIPCWVLMKWKDSNEFGDPGLFYSATFDETSGLALMGEYPYEGRYEVLQMFYQKEWVNNKLVIHRFPMCSALVDVIIPIILRAERMSESERKRVNDEAAAIRKKAENDEAADMLSSRLPAWYDATSYAGQKNHNSVLQRKDDELEALFKRYPHLRVQAEQAIQKRKAALAVQQ